MICNMLQKERVDSKVIGWGRSKPIPSRKKRAIILFGILLLCLMFSFGAKYIKDRRYNQKYPKKGYVIDKSTLDSTLETLKSNPDSIPNGQINLPNQNPEQNNKKNQSLGPEVDK